MIHPPIKPTPTNMKVPLQVKLDIVSSSNLEYITGSEWRNKGLKENANFLETALKKVEGDISRLLSLPQYIDLLLEFSQEYLWSPKLAMNSQEWVGETQSGNKVAVVTHGNGIVNTPEQIERIAKNWEKKIYKGSNTLWQTSDSHATSNKEPLMATKKQFHNLLKGKIGNQEVPAYSFSEFRDLDLKRIKQPYSVVIDFDTARRLQSEGCENTIPYTKAYSHELVIARLGGEQRTADFIKAQTNRSRLMIFAKGINSAPVSDLNFGQPHGYFLVFNEGAGKIGSALYLSCCDGAFPALTTEKGSNTFGIYLRPTSINLNATNVEDIVGTIETSRSIKRKSL